MKRSVGIALLVAAGFVAYVVTANWAGNGVTSARILSTLVIGVSLAAIYAMYATGLVVVYTTTGIFNFAQGAIGAFCAFLYWELHVHQGWNTLLSIFVVVFVVAPVIGVLIDVLIMRNLQGATLVLQLMVTVGLMLFFLGITSNIWRPTTARRVNPFYGNGGFDLGPIVVQWHRLITVIVALAVALILRVVLYRTRLGVAMRAVVDNRNLAALNGARPNVISASSWAIGCSLAAIAGILIAPSQDFTPDNFNVIIIVAFAAAAFGQLKNLPLTLVGCAIIGIGRTFAQQFLNFGPDWPQASNAIAPILLFIVVLALPQSRLEVGRAVRNLKKVQRYTRTWEAVLGMAVLFVVVGLWSGTFSQVGLNRSNQAIYTAIIVLSLIPLTGWAGQVNFAPLAFAGFGAFLFQHFAGDSGNMWYLLLVALLCAPLGALVALPASRLKGLYLALASMAFAHGMALIFFPHPKVFPETASNEAFQPLKIFGYVFDERRSLLLLMTGFFCAIVIGLVALRRSRYGRRWVALNDSPAACATVGVNVRRTTVYVYALSSAIAGFGGALMGVSRGIVSEQDYDLILGLPFVLLAAVGGIVYPIAGLFAGISTVLFIIVKERWDLSIFAALEVLGPGLMALGMVAKPNGAVEEMGKGFAPLLPWRKDAREELAREKAQKREPEIGELGIDRPFTNDAVVSLDRHLGILSEVTPNGGYLQYRPDERGRAAPVGAGAGIGIDGEEADVGALAGH